MKTGRRKLRISIVGAGSVGTALAFALYKSGHSIVSVISKRLTSAKRVARLVRCRSFSNQVSFLPRKQDLILLTVPDDAVKSTALQLWRLNIDFEGVFVGHTSGVLTSDVLRPVESRGAHTFSLHPMQTFPRRASLKDRLRTLEGISYGFEGSRESHFFVRELVKDLGGIFLPIPKEAKILYHLCCVLASNYPVVLMSVVENLASQFLKRPNLRYFRKLVETSVANAFVMSPAEALTGPLVRGNLETVRAHLLALAKSRKDILPLYRELGLAALETVRKRLGPKPAKRLKKILLQTRPSLRLRRPL